MTASAVASRAGFTLEEIDDLRIAVDEAASLLLSVSPTGGSLRCRFEYGHEGLVSVLSVPISGAEVLTERVFLVGSQGCVERRRPDRIARRTADRVHSSTGSVSGEARSAMSVTPDPEAVQSLVGDLESSDLTVREAAREELIALHMPLVGHLARRFGGRGEPLEDLVQVGMVRPGQAVDRFERDRGATLASFAAPTVFGEIKRHFRDKGWAIRVPRSVQAACVLPLVPPRKSSTHESSSSPTVAEPPFD